jgi:hypothetical protein
MGAEDYRIGIRCRRCHLQLFRSPKSVTEPIVFCDYCLVRGPYKDIVEDEKPPTNGFVTREQAAEMLREMGRGGK